MTVDEALAQARQHQALGEFDQCRALCNAVLHAMPRHGEAIRIFRSLPATATYDAGFYEAQMANSYRSAQVVLGHLFATYAPRSMVDFGAGRGTWLEAARELGVGRLQGIEGHWVSDDVAGIGFEYAFQDLQERVVLDSRFDLALSVEVAEHLVPERAPTFVEDLCAAADLVVFGAALPHQGGNGHFNERFASFWIELFRTNGYACVDFFRAALWFRPDVEPWYAQNTFLFVRKGDPREPLFKSQPLYDVHHPALVNSEVVQRFKRGWGDEG
jgi:hypothetical protein